MQDLTCIALSGGQLAPSATSRMRSAIVVLPAGARSEIETSSRRRDGARSISRAMSYAAIGSCWGAASGSPPSRMIAMRRAEIASARARFSAKRTWARAFQAASYAGSSGRT